MTAGTRGIVAAWLAGLAVCAALVARTEFNSDLSAFLPRSPSPEQRVLVEQLRDGAASRLVLIAIEGRERAALAASSRKLASALRRDASFISVDNGEAGEMSRNRDYVWRNRYLLSPDVRAARFSEAGLREVLEKQLRRLASPAGLFGSATLAADPTGELLAITGELGGQTGLPRHDGVWITANGRRALLVARTRAYGSDTEGQARAVQAIRGAFAALHPPAGQRLELTGPGVFSVEARARIKGDAWRLSLVATALIVAMLLALYRSWWVLALGLVPVASGALAGVAAVGVGFGSVHGVTLGFGVTLIGEGVDYAIYLFTQKPADTTPQAAFARIWPTLRLGMLTSVCGFAALLFSGFTGLAQIGLFSITGLLVAAALTRWLLPALTPHEFSVTASGVARGARVLVRAAPRLRFLAVVLLVAAVAFLALRYDRLWSADLASLSPVPASAQRLDQKLRRELGAPDVRHLVVVHAASEENALQAAERVGAVLRHAVRQGWLAGFDSPALLFPSRRTQLTRQAALPARDALERNLAQAVQGLPFRPGAFAPFVADVAAAKQHAPLGPEDLQGSNVGLKVNSLLVQSSGGRWTAMLPLRGLVDGKAVARDIAALREPGTALLDLKHDSESLYRSYLGEALRYSAAGAAAIAALLLVSLRSARRALEVLAPLAVAAVMTAALLAFGGPLSLLHLIGLLLVVAVGSNYALFFDSLPADEQQRGRTLVSLAFAAASTITAFGVLSFSSVQVLHVLGSTVSLGATLALILAAVFSRHARAV